MKWKNLCVCPIMLFFCAPVTEQTTPIKQQHCSFPSVWELSLWHSWLSQWPSTSGICRWEFCDAVGKHRPSFKSVLQPQRDCVVWAVIVPPGCCQGATVSAAVRAKADWTSQILWGCGRYKRCSEAVIILVGAGQGGKEIYTVLESNACR